MFPYCANDNNVYDQVRYVYKREGVGEEKEG